MTNFKPTKKNLAYQDQNYYHLLSLSVPTANFKSKNGFSSSIYSKVNIIDFKFKSNELLMRMHYFDIKNFILIVISDDTEENDLSKNTFSDYINGSTYSLNLIGIHKNKFFTLDFINKLFQFNRRDNYKIFFLFKNIEWKDIPSLFFTVGIDISGGSNSKKHLLSPLQHRLSQFLTCIYGSESSNIINSSFHDNTLLKYYNTTKLGNFNKKSIEEKYIDFAQTQEIFKNRILATSPLSISEILDDTTEKDSKENESINNSAEGDYSNNDNNLIKNDEINKINNINITPPASAQGALNYKNFHTSAYLSNSKTKKSNDLSINPVSPAKAAVKKQKDSIIFNYLESIKQIVDSAAGDESSRREAQLKFENNWISLIEENLKDEKYFLNRYQGRLFSSILAAKETLNIMNDNKYLKKKFPQFSSELNKIDFLLLTFSLCISLYSRLSYNSLAIKTGEEIIFLLYKNQITNDGTNFNEFKKSLNVDTKFYFLLGDFFMSILQQFPHEIFIRKIKLDSYYTQEPYYLELNNEYLDDIKNNLIINPNTLPMLCKPNEWTEFKYGGYLSNQIKSNEIITKINYSNHNIENRETIYKAVNYLNSIKFCVNNILLNYLLSSDGNYILQMIKPEDELQRIITLKMAELYKDTYFYLNTHADWRGRIYTESFFLSYQSGDLSTALLNFWDGEQITAEGKVYLYIYGANSHNQNSISKDSYANRIKWVNDNYDKIINLDRELILSAESPFIFTAFCLNMREIHNNPAAIIKTPVFLDATCSGIQHLAALMKDFELGINTNLIPSTNDDIPGDIYTSLLDPINNAINKFGEENLDYSMLSLVQLTRKEIKTPIMTKVYNVSVFGISQQLQTALKKNFNNDSNNDGLPSAHNIDLFENELSENHQSKIEDDLMKSLKSKKSKNKFICKGKDGKSVTLNKKEIYKIATIINEQIFVLFPSLNYIYNYFLETTKLSIKLGIQITWITPSGLKITQNYLKKKKKIISVSIFGKTKKIVLREIINKLDSNKQSQAIIPNIIHSLDAAHLINLIISASQNNFKPLITIHDCFGTLPNHMGELSHKVKKEFVLLYTDNTFLKNFHQRFIQNITDNQYKIIELDNKSYVSLHEELLEIPILPTLGKLDINKITESKYMIA